MKIGVVSPEGNIQSQRTVPSPGFDSPTQLTDWLAATLMDLHNEIRDRGMSLRGAGIGIPGPLRFPEGILYDPPNLPLKGEIPLRALLQKRLPFPIFLDNDVTMQTLGELWRGGGTGISHFILLSFGTGIGGGIVVNGKAYRGTHGFAGEIGHLTIDFQGRPCHCGSRGCLETYASLNGLAQTLREWNTPLPHDLTAILQQKRHGDIPRLLAEKIRRGENQWQEAWDIFADALGAGIGSLINLFNPQRVILSGGLAHYSEFFLPRTLERIPEHCFKVAWKQCEIHISRLKNKAGILGAAYQVFLSIKKGATSPDRYPHNSFL